MKYISAGYIVKKSRSFDTTYLLLIWLSAVLFAFLCAVMGKSFSGSSGYPTYTLQALAWRNGHFELEHDYVWLELAIYEGKYYVSFPPVPTIPLYLLTFIFDVNTPDNLLVKLYVLTGLLSFYAMLKKAGYDKVSACIYAVLFSFASCLTALTLEGAVWYQAQTMAFALTSLSAALMFCNHPTLALVSYAFAVGCRPFNALFGPVLYIFYLERELKNGVSLREVIRRLIPGTILGLFVAVAYAVFNYARFGNIFEFGHNYLPEFSFQGNKQFSLDHLARNIQTFIFGLPFYRDDGGVLELQQFGFSFLIACPGLALCLLQFIIDLFRKRFSFTRVAVIFCMLLQLFLLLLHHTFGGYQFGARYTCDMLPYAALYFALPGRKRKITLPETCLTFAALAFMLYGTIKMAL